MAKTVDGLKSFTRLDQAEFQFMNIHEGIDRTLALLEYEFAPGVSVNRVFGDLPEVYCSPGSLNQVFMILIQSARKRVRSWL